MKIAKRYIVKGRVQGVGFRYFTHSIAMRIGVYGYVKNLFDGSVEVYAIGTLEQLENLKTGIARGPSYSMVDEVIEEDMPVEQGHLSFEVRY